VTHDFEPGEKIRIKGTEGNVFYFVGQVGDTVYATTIAPGYATTAMAYTDRPWERVPGPFFEEGKTYKYVGGEFTYAVHRVFEMEGERYAAVISSLGNPILFGEGDFEDVDEV